MNESKMSFKRSVVTLVPYFDVIDQTNWLSKWKKTVRSTSCLLFACREEMYRHIQNRVLNDSVIDYLEFGVAAGDSLRYWCGINLSPESRFFGFDSFRGLPESWKKSRPQGTFGRNGAPPEIPDSRIQFQIGWFQDTLPAFVNSFVPRGRVVLHNDSDLYSSTLYTLTMMDRFLKDGAIVIFDEFYDVRHEYRAWIEYTEAYKKSPRIIAATKNFAQVAIEF